MLRGVPPWSVISEFTCQPLVRIGSEPGTGKLVAHKAGHDVADIEGAVAALVLQVVAVGRHGIAHIAGVVDGVAVSVVEGRRETLPQRLAQLHLQRVVVGIGHREDRVDGGQRRVLRRIGADAVDRLVDVAEHGQFAADAADIAGLQDGRGGELALDVQVEILHVGRAEVLADAEALRRAEPVRRCRRRGRRAGIRRCAR